MISLEQRFTALLAPKVHFDSGEDAISLQQCHSPHYLHTIAGRFTLKVVNEFP